MDIQNRIFLISGGGSGLGAATARLLVASGAKVVIADINEATGAAVATELGAQALFVHTDVTQTDTVQRAVDLTVEAFGTIHGAISAAGTGTPEKTFGRAGPHDIDRFQRVLQVNLVGTFNVIRLAAQVMVNNQPSVSGERGVIINTASVAAFEGQIGQAAYSASKAGVVGMTLPIARDLASYGIRVVTIAPGMFDTPLLSVLSEPARKSLEASVPFPSRLGRPSEYAALVKHIVENEMLNGECIRLDGALRLAPR